MLWVSMLMIIVSIEVISLELIVFTVFIRQTESLRQASVTQTVRL